MKLVGSNIYSEQEILPLVSSLSEAMAVPRRDRAHSHRLLVDLHPKVLKIINSRSIHFPRLSKYAAFSLLSLYRGPGSDSFFTSQIESLLTEKAAGDFLFSLQDYSGIFKTIPESNWNKSISYYCHSLRVPYSFRLWLDWKNILPIGSTNIVSCYRDLEKLLMEHREEYEKDCVLCSVHPSQFLATHSRESTRCSLEQLASRRLRKQFLSRTSAIEIVLHELVQAIAQFPEEPWSVIQRLSHQFISAIKESWIESAHGAVLPFLPYLSYLISADSGLCDADISNEKLNAGSYLSGTELYAWFSGRWSVQYPSSLIMCPPGWLLEQSRALSSNANKNPMHQSVSSATRYNTESTLIKIFAEWNINATGLTKNGLMSLAVLKANGHNVLATKLGDPKPYGASVHEKTKHIALFHYNADSTPFAILHLKCITSPHYCDRVFGFYLWETETPPPIHELGIALVDKVLVPTLFLERVYKRYSPSSDIVNIGKYVEIPSVSSLRWSSSLPECLRDASLFKITTVFDAGSGIERKNPLALLNAYITEFHEDEPTVLIIKGSLIASGHWGDPFLTMRHLIRLASTRKDVFIITDRLSDIDLFSLLSLSDCIASTHRAEGFGYLLAYAVLMQKKLVATYYSGLEIPEGVADFYPVDYKIVPAPMGKFYHDSLSAQEWASPSHASIRRQLRAAFRDHVNKEASRIDPLAHSSFCSHYSSNEYYQRLAKELEII